jgi:hypothetical protein
MSNESNAIEQAVARALRDGLERLQRNSDELHHAVNDVVSACSSNKPSNALPFLLRAQTGAASLSATLEVLSRFVALTLQPGARSPLEAEISRIVSGISAKEAPPVVQTEPTLPSLEPPQQMPTGPASERFAPPEAAQPVHAVHEPVPAPELEQPPQPEVSSDFDVNRLTSEEQELHRRANRVAKVSMQDIKMLHPDQVRQGRENKDICIRLKDDIEKAHREYDRRFKPIMDHPVDYFYRWMVEILAEGDASALGEYPYAVTARHH